jgi:multidrug efflux system membrane fusion protein
VWLAGALLALAGGPALGADEPLRTIPVARPLAREVVDYQDFTGRTEPATSVALRARVSGYLVKVLFQDGAEVKRGDVLFEIDPRPYQAELDKARAGLALAGARLRRAEAGGKRAADLTEKTTIGPGELDKIAADREEALAGVQAARATLELARLTLDFTRVSCPIDGRIGRRLLDPGNVVKADETLLAHVVGEDPMYACFEVDQATLLRLRRAVNGGRLQRAMPVLLGLAGEEGYPHRGTADFPDNQVNPGTGGISLRAAVANPRPPGGERLLSPGLSVRVRLATGLPHQALLVADRAVGTDRGVKYVFVVSDKGVLEYRRVSTGQLHGDGLREITGGLQADEWVAVGGLKGLRPQMVVRPEKEP